MFPLAQFRILFPAFATVGDDVVLAVADWAQCYTSGRGCKCSEQLWMLITAHLLQLRVNADTGGGVGSVGIDWRGKRVVSSACRVGFLVALAQSDAIRLAIRGAEQILQCRRNVCRWPAGARGVS